MPRRLALVIAVLATAAAAWLSQGAMAFTRDGGDRIVMLPLSVAPAMLVVSAAALVVMLARAGASLVPLWLLAFVFLPWIPGDIPAPVLLWIRTPTLIIWCAIAILMGVSAFRSRRSNVGVGVNRPPLVAAALALVVYALAAWQVSPTIPGGDEPHYLVITQSLLKDGDLRVENNHRQGDYRAYYAAPLQPDFRRRGRDGQIYSIHAPGVSALVAPAFAIGGYRAAVAFLLIVAAAGSGLAWYLASLATRRADAAWFGWAAVTLSATSIFHSFTVYPDGPGGVLALTGLWALLRTEQERGTASVSVRAWVWHGAALAALPWLHTRFALLAGTFGALILLRLARTPNAAAKAVAFLSVPALSAVCWIGYFVAIYGTPDPSVPYAGESGSFAFVPGALVGLLFDQRFGLLAYAPVLAAGFLGLGVMVARRVHARLALELLFVLLPYLLTVTHFAMWWGGWSAPARFAAPVLPLLAVPAAICWAWLPSVIGRAAALTALGLTAFASLVLVFADGGRLAYNSIRDSGALWLPRINPQIDLAAALPLWSRTADWPLFRDTGAWLIAGVLAWAGGRWLATRHVDKTSDGRTRLATVTFALWVVIAMCGLAVVWGFRDSRGVTVAGAQMEMLRQVAQSRRVLAIDAGRGALVARDNIPGRLSIDLSRALSPRAGARDDRPLFAIPALPAGEYRLSISATETRGWIMVGAGRDQFALRTEPVSVAAAGSELRLSVGLRELVVRGDEDARQVVRTLRLEPLALYTGSMRADDAFARLAVRYGSATVFFLDEGSFPEPEAFWVTGAGRTSVVVQPDERRPAVDLHVRNAPVDNRVTVQAGKWKEELTLAAGEERRVRAPLDPGRDATRIEFTTSAGFRPSAVDANSRDDRYLGVWIRIE